MFVTSLRREWPHSTHSYRQYWCHPARIHVKPDDPLGIYRLVTEPRFWLDVGVVRDPKDHPMINAIAEKAKAEIDNEDQDHDGSLRVLEGLAENLAISAVRAAQLASEAENLRKNTENSLKDIGL